MPSPSAVPKTHAVPGKSKAPEKKEKKDKKQKKDGKENKQKKEKKETIEKSEKKEKTDKKKQDDTKDVTKESKEKEGKADSTALVLAVPAKRPKEDEGEDDKAIKRAKADTFEAALEELEVSEDEAEEDGQSDVDSEATLQLPGGVEPEDLAGSSGTSSSEDGDDAEEVEDEECQGEEDEEDEAGEEEDNDDDCDENEEGEDEEEASEESKNKSKGAENHRSSWAGLVVAKKAQANSGLFQIKWQQAVLQTVLCEKWLYWVSTSWFVEQEWEVTQKGLCDTCWYWVSKAWFVDVRYKQQTRVGCLQQTTSRSQTISDLTFKLRSA